MINSFHFLDREIPVSVWSGEKMGGIVSGDTETGGLFRDGYRPPLFSFQVFDGDRAFFVLKEDIANFFEQHKDVAFVFHNAAYDLRVLEEFWNVYSMVEDDRIGDTSIIYRLLELAESGQVPFKYSLSALSEIYLVKKLDKTIRETFIKEGVPENFSVHDMTVEQQEYALTDAVCTYYIFEKLKEKIEVLGEGWLSHFIQLKGDIALSRLNTEGIHIDVPALNFLRCKLEQDKGVLIDKLALYGVLPGVSGNKAAFDSVIDFFGMRLPKDKNDKYNTAEEVLLPYAEKNQFIKSYIEYKYLEKHASFLYKLGGKKVYPKYSLLKKTGRTGCSNPNFQQLPKSGGVRELFIPKPGNTFIITDYSAIELCALAQVTYSLYGFSIMREKLNSGEDLHSYYAAILLNKDSNEITKEERQKAKAANFGFPGGLGIEKFMWYAKTDYGLTLSLDEAKKMKEVWFSAFPEVKKYMQGSKGWAKTLTGRFRNDCSFCAEKNMPFQGLAADGAKLALYDLVVHSPLLVVGFVHDEIISECGEGSEEEGKKIQEECMIKNMNVVIPDVRIKVETTLSKFYCK